MWAGAIHDAIDRAGIQELLINAELADRAQAQDVQGIVEGPGHVLIDEIATTIQLMKRVTNNKPFYMLRPIVTDIAPGYDDRVAAIGATISSATWNPLNTLPYQLLKRSMKVLSNRGLPRMSETW